MAGLTGATPLFALRIAGVDTETTGLDPEKARIVEIGSVHFDGRGAERGEVLDQRVDPQMPIPDKAREIHGISDEMVRGAPLIGAALPGLKAHIAGRLVVGHAIGFDLAVLENEAKRAGVAWERPRSLCVRTLAMIAAPSLANHSLDALAHWLEIQIENRHRALGDAEAAARVFFALLPALEEKGIRTLGQAERACRSRTPDREREAAAGWAEPVADKPSPLATLTGPETYAYRHVVADVMTAEVSILPEDASLKDAMDAMVARNASSVLVAQDPSGGQDMSAYGILTERDVLRRIAAQGPAALDLNAGSLASRPLHSIRANAFVYRAIGRLDRLKVRHLAVRSDLGQLVGVVSARDLLRLQGGPAIALDDAIEVATSADHLAAAWATLPAVAGTLLHEKVDAGVVCRIVSEEIRAMTRRAAVLAERQMAETGHGAPPCPYAVLVLGSGGRGESLLAPDQDNAIVFDAPGETGAPGGAADIWFAELGARLADILDRGGIVLCRGGVMARNAAWRGSIETWRERIDIWLRQSSPEDLLNVDIFFDLVPVHGRLELGQALFEQAYAMGSEKPAFAKLMGEQLAAIGDPFTLLGALRLEDGRIDVKKFGLFPIVALARTLCIRHGLALRSTAARLVALAQRTGGHADLAALARAHGVLLAAMLSQQSRDIEQGLVPTNRVDPRSMPRDDAEAVRLALRQVKAIPALVRDLMFG